VTLVIGCGGAPSPPLPQTAGGAASGSPASPPLPSLSVFGPTPRMFGVDRGTAIPYGNGAPLAGAEVVVLDETSVIGTGTVTKTTPFIGCNPWMATTEVTIDPRTRRPSEPDRCIGTPAQCTAARALLATPPTCPVPDCFEACEGTGSGCYGDPVYDAWQNTLDDHRRARYLVGGGDTFRLSVAVEGIAVSAAARVLDPHLVPWDGRGQGRMPYLAVDDDGDGDADIVTDTRACPAEGTRCYDTFVRGADCADEGLTGWCRVGHDPASICFE
jgi:hypothetical protein